MYKADIMVYSKARHGKDPVSDNFKVREFACKDGSDVVFVSDELVGVLQDVRDFFGKAVTINSAYRTIDYNEKVAGSKNSYHCYGMAADIVVRGVPAANVYQYLNEKYPSKYGIGKYSGFTHIDVRFTKARWKG